MSIDRERPTRKSARRKQGIAEERDAGACAQTVRLLCPRRERPRSRRAAEQRDERAALYHSKTSSAHHSLNHASVFADCCARPEKWPDEIATKITHANAKMGRRTTARAESALGRVSDRSVEASIQVIRSAVTPTTIRIAPKKATSFAALISSVLNMGRPRSA
jgi:hypothetical protein